MLVNSVGLELLLVIFYPLFGVLDIILCLLEVHMNILSVFGVLEVIGKPVAIQIDDCLFGCLIFGILRHACSLKND